MRRPPRAPCPSSASALGRRTGATSASPRRCSPPSTSREAHGGEGRIKAARFPARKTLEEFDFSFQRSVKKTLIQHLGQLDFLHGRENVVAWAARHRQDAL
jgi:DNA replication protein DnaC